MLRIKSRTGVELQDGRKIVVMNLKVVVSAQLPPDKTAQDEGSHG